MAAAVLSGNRNFEARVHQSIKANFLMSPPLVVAFALAGRVDIDLPHEPLGKGKGGEEVFLKDIWPTLQEVRDQMQAALKPEIFRQLYRDFAEQNPKWNEIPSSTGSVYQWEANSTYIQEPPFFLNFELQAGEIREIKGARALGIFGDTVTTDGQYQEDFAGWEISAGAWSRGRGFQQLWLAARERPRDDARDVC